jgi:hypothetical protein
MLDFNANLAVSDIEIRPSTVAALVYDEQSYPDEIMKHSSAVACAACAWPAPFSIGHANPTIAAT